MAEAEPPHSSGNTDWTWRHETPLSRFLRTESGSAATLLAATIAALVWANVAGTSYQTVWSTELAVRVGGSGVAMSLVSWVNSGLMTFFFFVVGLEARRELDMGELRERRRVVLPLTAGVAGMTVAVLLYLVVNFSESSARGWGVAMSTDTAFALGMLALIGPRFPERLRAFLLTVVVIDDVVALLVIATVYTSRLDVASLLVAFALFAGILVLSRLHVRRGVVYLVVGIATWVALHRSGVDPVVVGLAMGLLTYASPAGREDLERATDRFRDFREQPTPELARSARAGLQQAISPNERLQEAFHPWTSYVIVPLFALANAGIPIQGDFLSQAYRSPITLGIIAAYVVGKPVGVLAGSWLVTRATGGRLRPPVGWAAVAGGGTIAGIGFTVSLLIATLAFSGRDLEEIYSVREAVEGHAARLLVGQGPQAVERVAMEMHALAEQSWTTGDAAYHANRLAHRSVVQATGNRVLLEMFDDLWGRAVALRIWADYYASTPMEGDVEFDHELLLSALRSGSPDRAQQAMVEHVREGLHRHGTRSVTAP